MRSAHSVWRASGCPQSVALAGTAIQPGEGFKYCASRPSPSTRGSVAALRLHPPTLQTHSPA